MFHICLKNLVFGIHRTALIFIGSWHWSLLNIALTKTLGHTLCQLIDWSSTQNKNKKLLLYCYGCNLGSRSIFFLNCLSSLPFIEEIWGHDCKALIIVDQKGWHNQLWWIGWSLHEFTNIFLRWHLTISCNATTIYAFKIKTWFPFMILSFAR